MKSASKPTCAEEVFTMDNEEDYTIREDTWTLPTVFPTLGRLKQGCSTSLDTLIPYWVERWIATIALVLFYLVRVFWLAKPEIRVCWFAYSFVSYTVWIYVLGVLFDFSSPMEDPQTNEPIIPEYGNGEFKPFYRKIPEFLAWWKITRAVLIAVICTFFRIFDIPVAWQILVVYAVLLAVLMMRKRINHMIRYKYVPWVYKPRHTKLTGLRKVSRDYRPFGSPTLSSQRVSVPPPIQIPGQSNLSRHTKLTNIGTKEATLQEIYLD